MGLTYVVAKIQNPRARRSRRVRLLVDSGAVYSVLPRAIWRKLGLQPIRTVEFSLADGRTIEREISQADFSIRGRFATSPVVLGDDHDSPLLGAVTLETIGLALNPFSRELFEMSLPL